MVRFLSRNIRLGELKPYEHCPISNDGPSPSYLYVHKATVHDDFPMRNYAEDSTVAFTRPDASDIAMPSLDRMQYQDGVNAWPFVLMHEEMHIDGYHDESGINARCRAKLGYWKDPFPGYAYSMS